MAKHRATHRRRPPHSAQTRLKKCVVCQTCIDPPVLIMRTSKGPAHLLCAALDRIGLGELARTSGR